MRKFYVRYLVSMLVALVILAPWGYREYHKALSAMEPQVVASEPPAVADVPLSLPPEPSVDHVVPAQAPATKALPEPVPTEPAHYYTPSCADEVPMQTSHRGANLRYAILDQLVLYPCPQPQMKHVAPVPLKPGMYRLPYGSVTVLGRK